MFRKMLVASDGSKAAANALSAALVLAKRWRAKVHLVVVEEVPYFPGTREEVIGDKVLENRKFVQVVQRAEKMAKTKGVALKTHVLVGHPVRAIAEFARKNKFDLLVIGSTGHSELYNLLVGSTADRILKASPCSILIVK
jgi:nucleotide-binding universal stress UspA family protein